MKLTQAMIDYCESQPWDDDMRQDVYVKVMETPETEVNNPWLSRIYTNLCHDEREKNRRRQELIDENIAEVRHLLGMDDIGPDVVDELEAAERLIWKVKDLSPLLRATLYNLLIEGMGPEEIADKEQVKTNVIYKRLHDIKQHVTG